MDFALATFWKDLARWRRDPGALLLWLLMPLLIGALITSLIGGGAQPKGLLLVVDQDESLVSGFVVRAYGGGQLGDLLTVEQVELAEGAERIDGGDASGLLIIPDGFGAAFLNNEPETLTLKTNPSQFIVPGIITDVTEILLDAGFYVQRLFASEIETIAAMDEVPADAVTAALAVQIGDKIERIAPQLFPPAIEVEIVEPETGEPGIPVALLYVPGIVLMAMMFAANGTASDYWAERDHGTLRRLVNAPGRLGGFVAGKALAATTIVGAIGAVTLLIGFLYHGIPFGKLPAAIAWIAVSGAALFAWFAALQMLFKTQKAASVVSTLILFPLLMAGGSFFPLAVMPDWIATLGLLAPNGYVADRLTTQLTDAGVWLLSPASWLVVVAAALSGLLVCVWRLRAGFARA